VVAPSLIPTKSGDRVKTDRRDATMLARLHRAGELTSVWVPDAAHEAMRDLIRLRSTVRHVLTRARQHLQGFLLRHGRSQGAARAWSVAYRRWLSTLAFDHPAQQIAFQDYVDAVTDAEQRLRRVEEQIQVLLADWTLRPVVEALQALRGIALINAVVLVSEVGDFTRFANPRQLMAYFGMVPGERSTGRTVRRGGMNRAEFSGGWVAWILRGHRCDLKLSVVGGFRFGGRDAADGLEQTPVVVPVDPFESGKLDGLKRAPRTTPMDHFGFEQANHSFRQGIVIRVANTADRWLNPRLGEALGVLQ
jgi:hypothetical protein